MLFIVVLCGEPKYNQGRRLVDRILHPHPLRNVIADRPKAALLFRFFGGFRCSIWLCFVILVTYKNRKQVK